MKKYFRDWGNFISFALALIPAILLNVFQPGDSVPYIVFVTTFFLAFLFAWLSLKLYLDLHDTPCISTIEIINCTNNRCLCKPCSLLNHHSIVSFFEDIDGFEKQIAYGYVETITNKGLIQIVLFPSEEDKFSHISNHKGSIIIKPTISYETIRDLKMEAIYEQKH